jgi:hypothetical protein
MKGEAKGKAKERKQIVLKSHHAGLPEETIAIITGLTIREIREIIKN